GRVSGWRFALSDWAKQHRDTVRSTDDAVFAEVCGEIASTGFTAVELWQALADPAVMDIERAKKWRAIADAHGLEVVAYGGYLGTGAEKVCRWLGTNVINGGFGLKPDEATALCTQHDVYTNFENHPQSTVDEILSPIGGGNDRLGVCVDTGWLGTNGADAAQVIHDLGPSLVRWVHIKDVRTPGKHDTCPLGEGIVDIEGCITALHDIGYDGYLSWEDEPEDRNPLEIAAEMRVWLEQRLAALDS
ncbi:MAG: sugar phosphate isomerase/epimerase family protein, partial [Actinomycetota bacterium]